MSRMLWQFVTSYYDTNLQKNAIIVFEPTAADVQHILIDLSCTKKLLLDTHFCVYIVFCRHYKFIKFQGNES